MIVKRNDVFRNKNRQAYKVKSIKLKFAKLEVGKIIDKKFYVMHEGFVKLSIDYLLNKCKKIEVIQHDLDWLDYYFDNDKMGS